jgi:hypothetical protein
VLPQNDDNSLLEGSPPHYSVTISGWQNEYCQTSRLQNGVGIPWPPWSLNLTGFDFYFSGNVKKMWCTHSQSTMWTIKAENERQS